MHLDKFPGEHTPSEELRTRDFEKDLKRYTALDLHSITLAEYHRIQRIPRGLRVPLRPTLFQDNSDYCGKFEAILNKCSMDLIVLTIDFLQKEITELNSKISSTEQQLKSTSSPEDFKLLKDKVDKAVSDLRETLQTRKLNKFLRDTEDYRSNQVYKWQSSTYSRPAPRTFLKRKMRRGQRTRIGTTQNGDQITGITDNIVYNISSTCLSPSEMTVLQKGLSFCPVPRFNPFQLDQELYRFFRNVRLKAHFSRTSTALPTLPDQKSSEFTLNSLNLRLRSSFQPPRVYHPVETYIEFVKNDVKKVLQSIEKGDYHIKHNLTIEEKQALVSLRENKQIIVKPADKGGSIVVLDRDYYMQKIKTQLSDLDTYQPINHNPTFEIGREIKDLVTYYTTMGTIDTKLGEFLIKQHPVIPVFYTLPKIHKHPSKPPGRPIVAFIINASRNIETDLFVKSTDRNSLLKYDICHPHHIKRALPKSQHDRVDRIVSNPDTSRLRHSEMSAKFRSRGYPDHVLKFKQNTLGSDVSLRAPRLAFVSTFHPFNSLINKCILQHWDILKNAYPQDGIAQHNLQLIIWYILISVLAVVGYVGETTQHVRDRISKHKSTIRCGRSLLPIPAHFLQHNHTVAQLRYRVIDHVPLAKRRGDRIKQLKERESFWIYTLQTLSPHGLNREYEVSY
ncbi:unnamed protein product [Ranitomeya imitator]|uniref:Helix-turn-helix domain-containing protein n=1 Tax=Ranitomeya imitator TaxID=111125 RepID=A0ABN9MC28_9NEOB|nr:unnamed protein product [Ranitomeya imitator]